MPSERLYFIAAARLTFAHLQKHFTLRNHHNFHCSIKPRTAQSHATSVRSTASNLRTLTVQNPWSSASNFHALPPICVRYLTSKIRDAHCI
jgi:hypothetical protein